ncbi:MAG: beta-ketoacyl-[acyl-carrier-protein] synthase family protein [Acidobacteria bacterium]|nr:beta-ketoacyl-[acyl-carrier-protein] synthase family protein [Acidobacteriota bacterium]
MRRVVVTGLGAISGFGEGVGPLWEALLAGRSAIRAAEDARFGSAFLARVPNVPGDLRGETGERAHLLALAASGEALEGSALPPRTALVVGTTLGGNRAYEEWLAGPREAPPLQHGAGSPATFLARRLGFRGTVETVSVACASGTAAVGRAWDLIATGEVEAALAGGVDALSPFVVSGFGSLRALSPGPARPFDVRRSGLSLGEGAAFLLLESAEGAARAGRAPLAAIAGYGSASDAFHLTRPDPEGGGLLRAMSAAVSSAGLAGNGERDIAFVNAHGTGTVFNDAMEARAFARFFGTVSAVPPVWGVKGALGHTLGAAGAFEALVSVLALREGRIPPTAGLEEPDPAFALDVVRGEPRRTSSGRFALSTSAAFGGTNAVLVVERA